MKTRNIFFPEPRSGRLATLTRDIIGKAGFTKWKKGEVVRAVHVMGSSYAIEKLKLTARSLPLLTQCVGIPRSALVFHDLRKNGKFAGKVKFAVKKSVHVAPVRAIRRRLKVDVRGKI